LNILPTAAILRETYRTLRIKHLKLNIKKGLQISTLVLSSCEINTMSLEKADANDFMLLTEAK